MAKRPPKPLLRDGDYSLVSRPIEKPDPRQAVLQFDPMPSRIEPCLAFTSYDVPEGPQWLYEIQWDGHRIAVHVELNSVRIVTRGGDDWTDRFSAIAEAARAFMPQTMILDGEAVILDAEGRSDFGALQTALGGRGGTRNAEKAIMYAFDLLYLNGHDLTRLSQLERRQVLEDLLDRPEGAIRFSESIDTDDGQALFRHACTLGLEGIVAKHSDRQYRSGRSGDWLKIKCVNRDSFLVVGYEPSQDVRGSIARLLLGTLASDGNVAYAGSVGTGFSQIEARDLKRRLDEIRTDYSPILSKSKGVVAVSPVLFADVQFRGWTDDRLLRHASFKGLHEAGYSRAWAKAEQEMANHTDELQSRFLER